MTYTLTVSSQGQVVIPVEIRKHLGIKPGSKITIRPDYQGQLSVATIEPPTSWISRVKGISKGIYGKGENYVSRERKSWTQ